MQDEYQRRRRYEILMELAVVAVAGIFLAFVANRVSSHGLELTRNYFPTGTNNLLRTAPFDVPPNSRIDGAPATVYFRRQLAAQMHQEGLQLIDGGRALNLFHESESKKNVVFIDARDRLNYARAHIPGAYELDPYHPEQYLPVILPICRDADEVILYCTGGECDDSHSAALLLKQMGIGDSKLLVYGGGITEWNDKHLPVAMNKPSTGVPGIVKQ